MWISKKYYFRRFNPQVFINIGRAFLERNKFYKALIYVNKAIEIDKGFKEAYTFREDLLSTYAHNFKSDRWINCLRQKNLKKFFGIGIYIIRVIIDAAIVSSLKIGNGFIKKTVT